MQHDFFLPGKGQHKNYRPPYTLELKCDDLVLTRSAGPRFMLLQDPVIRAKMLNKSDVASLNMIHIIHRFEFLREICPLAEILRKANLLLIKMQLVVRATPFRVEDILSFANEKWTIDQKATTLNIL